MLAITSLVGGYHKLFQIGAHSLANSFLCQLRSLSLSSPNLGARTRKGPIDWYRVHWTWRIVNFKNKARKSKRTHSKAEKRFRVTRWGYQHLKPKSAPARSHGRLSSNELRKITSINTLHVDKMYQMGHYLPRNRIKQRKMPWVTSPNQTRMRNVIGHAFG